MRLRNRDRGRAFHRSIIAIFNDVFGAEPMEIGIIMTLTGFISLLASWIAGKASDRFGRKPVIALGGIPSRLSGAMIPLSPNLNLASILC